MLHRKRFKGKGLQAWRTVWYWTPEAGGTLEALNGDLTDCEKLLELCLGLCGVVEVMAGFCFVLFLCFCVWGKGFDAAHVWP